MLQAHQVALQNIEHQLCQFTKVISNMEEDFNKENGIVVEKKVETPMVMVIDEPEHVEEHVDGDVGIMLKVEVEAPNKPNEDIKTHKSKHSIVSSPSQKKEEVYVK